MHIYIFDYFLNQKNSAAIVAKIETRLTDLGLNGKNCHVGPLKSLKSIVKEELKNNPKTIVAVGNNSTLNQLINALDEENNTTIGIIPVGKNNSIAEAFGIADEDAACNVLSARLIETIDLGKINNQYFIASAVIDNKETIIEINGQYTIEPAGPGQTTIANLSIGENAGRQSHLNGVLKINITINTKGFIGRFSDASFIQTKHAIVNNLAHKNFIIDESLEIKTPANLSVAAQKLKVIVGKNRLF